MTTTFSLANLTAFNPLQLPGTLSPSDLLKQATTGVSSLLTELWSLPTVKGENNSGPLALLPTGENLRTNAYTAAGGDPTTYSTEVPVTLPRMRRLPEMKEKTRWEKFAEEKGIDSSKKRTRKVFDEETDEWKVRYGMGSKKNDEMSYPIMEADKEDPYANPWEKLREAKKTRIEDNQSRRGKNLERSGKLAAGTSNRNYKESQRARKAGSESNRAKGEVAAPGPGPAPSGVPVDFGKGGKDRGKASTMKALKATQRSTASLGMFDEKRRGEPEKKKVVSRRKFADNMAKSDQGKQMKILENVISGVDPNGGKNKNKGARGTAYDHEYNDGLGEQGFRKKKGRAGQGKMKKVSKKNIK